MKPYSRFLRYPGPLLVPPDRRNQPPTGRADLNRRHSCPLVRLPRTIEGEKSHKLDEKKYTNSSGLSVVGGGGVQVT